MKTYEIIGPSGERLATLSCSELFFDLEHQQEYVIKLNDELIAARLVLGDGMKIKEISK